MFVNSTPWRNVANSWNFTFQVPLKFLAVCVRASHFNLALVDDVAAVNSWRAGRMKREKKVSTAVGNETVRCLGRIRGRWGTFQSIAQRLSSWWPPFEVEPDRATMFTSLFISVIPLLFWRAPQNQERRVLLLFCSLFSRFSRTRAAFRDLSIGLYFYFYFFLRHPAAPTSTEKAQSDVKTFVTRDAGAPSEASSAVNKPTQQTKHSQFANKGTCQAGDAIVFEHPRNDPFLSFRSEIHRILRRLFAAWWHAVV